MKQFFISASGLDARGVGPRIMLITAPVLAAAIIFEIQSAPFFNVAFLQNPAAKLIGLIWLFAGIAAFIATMAQFISNFPKGKLLTSGMFACSRNPIYSCWIVFILPAIGIISSNWLFFVAAGIMCLATMALVKEEESQLIEVFGKPYLDYKNRVGRIISFPKK